MKSFASLLISLILIISLSGTVAIAANYEAIIELPAQKGNVEKFFAELNNNESGANPLFDGWSEQEIINFYETTRLLIADGDATSNLIKRYGIAKEANGMIRELVARGGEPHQYFAIAILSYYLVTHKLPPKAKMLYLWAIAAIEIANLQTHEPYQTIPASQWQITIIYKRF